LHARTVPSPLGPLTIVEDGGALTRLYWGSGHGDETPLLKRAEAQLDAYFSQDLSTFDLPFRVDGSDFQQAVCAAMASIPFGETRTYGEISKAVGGVPQAVGRACGGNPLPILIPCHRVLATQGLGGFSGDGGVETKIWLLRHEGAAGLLI
jgi:methylated-DNA-[protein]-cysteine S-methyltransferase